MRLPILWSIGTQLPAQLMCRTISMSNVETLVFKSPKIMLLCHGIVIWIIIVADVLIGLKSQQITSIYNHVLHTIITSKTVLIIITRSNPNNQILQKL